MTLVWVMLGAAVGAPARFLTDYTIRARTGSSLPWGTFVVNVVGSFLLGWITSSTSSDHLHALLGLGFCGALTTYSTFGAETLQAAQDGRPGIAWANVAVSVAAGAAACALGTALGGA